MGKNKLKGFTLIELLVVISIVGLLASVVLVSMASTLAKARDKVRFANKQTIKKALIMYKVEKGDFPMTKYNPATGTYHKYCFGNIGVACDNGANPNGKTLEQELQGYFAVGQKVSFSSNSSDGVAFSYKEAQPAPVNTTLGPLTTDAAQYPWLDYVQERLDSAISSLTLNDNHSYCYDYTASVGYYICHDWAGGW